MEQCIFIVLLGMALGISLEIGLSLLGISINKVFSIMKY
nr:MAG TPA: hypothetical protein [Inoviridae sp.]